MKIGIDLRVLQIGHQYRGIGEVAKQTLNEIFILAEKDKNKPQFIFYMYKNEPDPLSFLRIPKGLNFKVKYLGIQPLKHPNRTIKEKVSKKTRTLYGNPIPEAKESDVLLQFDYSLGVPKKPKTYVIMHDIIPYIFWKDYFTSPKIHIKNKAA